MSTEIASLSMYDFPHMAEANDQLWQAIRSNLGYGPHHLTRDMEAWEPWPNPDLLFSQTCGLPFRSALHDEVQLIGTPDYGLQGCPAGYYNSVIVVHEYADEENVAELDGQLLAYNDPLSQSGWGAVHAHMAKAGVSFVCGPCTGSHAASVQAIINGDADFVSIDALTWTLLKKHNPKAVSQVRVLERTEPTPTLPFITGRRQNVEAIRAAVDKAIKSLPTQTRAALHLKGMVQIPAERYLELPIPPKPWERNL